MKKLILKIAMLIAVTFLLNGSAYSANEYFRSVSSGNWNSNSTWQMSTNGGGTWFAATSTPTDTSGPITIQSPNTVTVSVNVNADQLTVNNGEHFRLRERKFQSMSETVLHFPLH